MLVQEMFAPGGACLGAGLSAAAGQWPVVPLDIVRQGRRAPYVLVGGPDHRCRRDRSRCETLDNEALIARCDVPPFPR